jgi:hypothetical protein
MTAYLARLDDRSLVVEPSGTAIVRGMVCGDVIAAGTAEVYGMITGSASGVGLVVHPGAVIKQ